MRSRPYTQDDVKRAIRGAVAAGLPIGRVEIDQSGKIVIVADGSDNEHSSEHTLDEWRSRRARMLKGINTVRKRLRDGTIAVYYYHRATGARLNGAPGSPSSWPAWLQPRNYCTTDSLEGSTGWLVTIPSRLSLPTGGQHSSRIQALAPCGRTRIFRSADRRTK